MVTASEHHVLGWPGWSFFPRWHDAGNPGPFPTFSAPYDLLPNCPKVCILPSQETAVKVSHDRVLRGSLRGGDTVSQDREGVCLAGRILSLFCDTLCLQCLWNVQGEMSSEQLEVCIWESGGIWT